MFKVLIFKMFNGAPHLSVLVHYVFTYQAVREGVGATNASAPSLHFESNWYCLTQWKLLWCVFTSHRPRRQQR